MVAGEPFFREARDILRGLRDTIDGIPYVALLGVPLGWLFWSKGSQADPMSGDTFEVWLFASYVALFAYVPSMLVCAVAEWKARRRGRTRMQLGVRLFRWMHFLVVFGPGLGVTIVSQPPPWGT